MAETDRSKIEEDIAATSFRIGRQQRKWRLIKKDWPVFFFGVRYAPDKMMCFRVNLEGYPDTAPQGTPWHRVEDRPLEGDELLVGKTTAKNKRLSDTFQGGNSNFPIYQPFDRCSFDGHHQNWATDYPHLIWNSERTITFYLEQLHDLLN